MNERRYDIDWLRNFSILLLFPFHAARVFDVFEPNYVKNAIWTSWSSQPAADPGLSWPLSLFIVYTAYWFMPLLFWLAGSSSWYALKKRDGGEYAGERVSRLLIPFLFGLFVIVPPQGYMARLMQGYDGGYLNYLLGYFTDFSDLSGYFGSFTPAHLWFILYLFVISLCVLPLMLAIRRRVASANGGGKPFWLLRWLEKPAVLLATPVLLTIAEALPDLGGKNPFYYASLFLLGYLAVSTDGMLRTINRLRFPALLALPVCLALYTMMLFRWQFGSFPEVSVAQAALALLRNLTLILTLIVLLGYANKYVNRSAQILPYLNRAAFPVYILHQTVMMVIAWFVVQWDLPVWGKFAAIASLSLAATMALYELAVRRVGFARVLFGVK